MSKRRHPESEMQRAFMRLVRTDARTKNILISAIPMGGKRNAREAAIMKAEGVLAGCPDILCFELTRARMLTGGLAIEFKVGSARPTEKQSWWHEQLRRCGWTVVVCRSARYAWTELLWHLGHDG